MNLTLQQALFENVRAYRKIENGQIKYTLCSADNEADYEDVMIIPNLSNEVIDEVLTQPAVAVNEQTLRTLKSSLNFVTDVANGKRPCWFDLFDELESTITAAEKMKGGGSV